MLRKKNVAIVTDVLVENGGADRLLRTLLKIFPDAQIFTSIFRPSSFPWLSPNRVTCSFIQKLPFRYFWYRHYVPLSPIAFEQFSLNTCDLVISVSAGCAKGVITSTDTKHIGVILTPPRYQWDGRKSRRRGLCGKMLDSYLRVWDVEASLRPDALVSISRFIQNKVKHVYKRDSTIIYPGIDQTYWFADLSAKHKRDDFYLVVSRLHDYKRIDLAIEACEKTERKLVVIGTGPEYRRLKRLSGKNTTFLGYCTDDEVRTHMRTCRAFLFPGVEDFGLAPVEAMSCGAPVIAYDGGGFPEAMEDGVTGLLFAEQTVDSLTEVLINSERRNWDSVEISSHATEFSEQNTIQTFKKLCMSLDDSR